MADYFETGILTDNEPAWHGAGIVKPEAVLTKAQVFEELPLLASHVIKVPLYAAHVDEAGSAHVVDTNGHFGLVREADSKLLGVAQTGYTIVQNDELFDFAESIIGQSAELSTALDDASLWGLDPEAPLPHVMTEASGPAVWKTAGTLRDGRQVWGMLRLPGDITIKGISEELYVPFMSVSNTFDRSGGVRAAVHWTRVVCANTLGAAFAEAPRSWSIRHTKSVKGRLAEARTALGIAYTYGEHLAELSAELLDLQVTDHHFTRFSRELLPMTPEALDSPKVRENIMGLRDGLYHVWDTAENLANVKNTAYGAYQAVVEWEQHDRFPDRNPDQRLKALFEGYEYAPRALELLTA